MRIFCDGWSSGFDGPGRRWVIYLHGCNFRWACCANPDSVLASAEGGHGHVVRVLRLSDLVRAARLRQPLFTDGGGADLAKANLLLAARDLWIRVPLVRNQ